jgi:enoyl-CoA hydratase/carnithine racemase
MAAGPAGDHRFYGVSIEPVKRYSVNSPIAHAELIATFRRAEAEAAHKFGLIKAAAKKGPKAIQMAVETADKAAKRRDAYAKKLAALKVDIKD